MSRSYWQLQKNPKAEINP